MLNSESRKIEFSLSFVSCSCVCVMTVALFWSMRTWLYGAMALVNSRHKRSRSTVAKMYSVLLNDVLHNDTITLREALAYVNQMKSLSRQKRRISLFYSFTSASERGQTANVYFTSLFSEPVCCFL